MSSELEKMEIESAKLNAAKESELSKLRDDIKVKVGVFNYELLWDKNLTNWNWVMLLLSIIDNAWNSNHKIAPWMLTMAGFMRSRPLDSR